MIEKNKKTKQTTGEQVSVFAQSSSQSRVSDWLTTNQKAARDGTSVHESANSL